MEEFLTYTCIHPIIIFREKSAQLRLFSFASVSRACFPLSFEQPIWRELVVWGGFTIQSVLPTWGMGDSSNLLLRLFGPSGIGSHSSHTDPLRRLPTAIHSIGGKAQITS